MCHSYLLLWISVVPLWIHGLVIEDFVLSGPGLPSAGLLMAKVNGTYGAVRYNSRFQRKDALDDLVCRTFGYVNESVVHPPHWPQLYTTEAALSINGCPDSLSSLYELNTSCKIIPGTFPYALDNLFKIVSCIPLVLVDGPSPLEGRLEAGLFGQLQTVCGHGFDGKAANVTCTSLGGMRTFRTTTENVPGKLPLYTRNIQCTGNEPSLEMCRHTGDPAAPCTRTGVVSVACHGGPLKLEPVMGNRSYEGILVGYHDNLWYDVIGQVSETTAKTFCSILGYGHVGFSTSARLVKKMEYYKLDVVCHGQETYIEECQGELKYCLDQRYWEYFKYDKLIHVVLFCSDYKLDNISLSASGVLQIDVNSQIWAVCAVNFTIETANNICTVLGFRETKSSGMMTAIEEPDMEILGSIYCEPNARSVVDCHIKHQFHNRLYSPSKACKDYVVLTCN
ncbi:neurotrypsin-like isoform X2 [Mya arenaria]|uniref:neurotrypsin-like isoform X2 n=1 Tax=Mya arenaria TaxID=6604 RepID=UPI0022DEFB30|nr:neurotrypsin-like isoform X2 [Mya arenaria]